jgi:hypothetical protein
VATIILPSHLVDRLSIKRERCAKDPNVLSFASERMHRMIEDRLNRRELILGGAAGLTAGLMLPNGARA